MAFEQSFGNTVTPFRQDKLAESTAIKIVNKDRKYRVLTVKNMTAVFYIIL